MRSPTRVYSRRMIARDRCGSFIEIKPKDITFLIKGVKVRSPLEAESSPLCYPFLTLPGYE